MKRKITANFIRWKEQSNRKPLIVRGARQVGKSYSIAEFGRNQFEGNLHVVNLEKQLNWHRIFDPDLDAVRIKGELEIVLNKKITPGRDLLFFDEIQACPQAIVALRYFYEQIPDLHVIAAGSLLEFALQDISFPVGRVQLLYMFPMNFVEFLYAMGKDQLASLAAGPIQAISTTIHESLRAELKRYFFIGGMPECVKAFSETQSMLDVFEIQSDLVNTYRQDFSKYNPRVNARCLNEVLFTLANRIGKQIKYSELSSNFSNPTIKKAFELLETARLIHKVRSTSAERPPLGMMASEKKFKAIILDIGLLRYLSGLSEQTEFVKEQLLNMFRGSLAEQFVGQEMLSNGKEELFYWARNAKSSTAELDYLTNSQVNMIPIEVKSGESGRLKSLHLYLQANPDIPKGYVLSDRMYSELPEQRLAFVPLYFAGRLVQL